MMQYFGIRFSYQCMIQQSNQYRTIQGNILTVWLKVLRTCTSFNYLSFQNIFTLMELLREMRLVDQIMGFIEYGAFLGVLVQDKIDIMINYNWFLFKKTLDMKIFRLRAVTNWVLHFCNNRYYINPVVYDSVQHLCHDYNEILFQIYFTHILMIMKWVGKKI